MKKVIARFYEFDEFTEEAQGRIISNIIVGWLCNRRLIPDECKNKVEKAEAEAERAQTPWFTNQLIYEYCKDVILSIAKTYCYNYRGEYIEQELILGYINE